MTDARVAWSGRIARTSLTPFAGLRNVFGRSYVGSVTVNGFNGRVFEPSPGRTFYLGLEARFVRP